MHLMSLRILIIYRITSLSETKKFISNLLFKTDNVEFHSLKRYLFNIGNKIPSPHSGKNNS